MLILLHSLVYENGCILPTSNSLRIYLFLKLKIDIEIRSHYFIHFRPPFLRSVQMLQTRSIHPSTFLTAGQPTKLVALHAHAHQFSTSARNFLVVISQSEIALTK